MLKTNILNLKGNNSIQLVYSTVLTIMSQTFKNTRVCVHVSQCSNTIVLLNNSNKI